MIYQLRLKGEARTATVAPIERGGIVYVPLSSLVPQFGGRCRILRGRVQVDLLGMTARVGLNETEVSASPGRFSLRQPILEHNDEGLMALADVEAFFEKAFRLVIRQLTPTEAESAPTGPAGPQVHVQELTEPGWDGAGMFQPPGYDGAPLRHVKVIIIDPGHGGADVGTEGRAGLKEKDLALALALKVLRFLEPSPSVRALLTRREDRDVGLIERATFANRNRGDLFISIHTGASFASGAHGFEVFYSSTWASADPGAGFPSPRGQDLSTQGDYTLLSREAAEHIAETLSRETSVALRGIYEAPCRLLREVAMPGLLIEVGYLTNAAEEALLESELRQDELAHAIATGIEAYLRGREPAGIVP